MKRSDASNSLSRRFYLGLSRLQRARQFASQKRQQGKIGWILLWLLGIPLPILFGLFLLRGCT